MKRLFAWLALLAAVPAHPALAAATAGRSSVLPWIVNDYPKALAEARARKVPLFIEAWAPW